LAETAEFAVRVRGAEIESEIAEHGLRAPFAASDRALIVGIANRRTVDGCAGNGVREVGLIVVEGLGIPRVEIVFTCVVGYGPLGRSPQHSKGGI
jgi:hypothetical protein